jgi:hypothetical protein
LQESAKDIFFGKVCPEFIAARRLQISDRHMKHASPLAIMGNISLDMSKWTSNSFLQPTCYRVKMVRDDEDFG